MRVRVREGICRAVIVLAALWSAAATARADGAASLAGNWQAGATSMDVAVESWGKDCGPRPQSSHSGAGGSVRIEQQEQTLIIHAGARSVRSDRCWSPNPMLHRTSSSYASGLWVTRCKTPDQDPREEQGTYTLKALAADRLLYQDVSRFNWKLNESTCVATITTTQTLQRVQGAVAPSPMAPAASATAHKPAPPPSQASPLPSAPSTASGASCKPGRAVRVSLRPHRAEIELGQRVCFHARVLDAAGCALQDAPISWSLEHGPAIKAKLQGGCFQAGDSSAESEGSFQVTAAHGALRAEAKVVVSAESLTALLASRLGSGALTDDEGEVEPAAAAVAPTPTPTPSTRVVARAVREPQRGQERWLIALAALLAAGSGVLLLMRRSSPRSRASTNKERSRPKTRRCPSCGATYPDSYTFCGSDGSELSPPR
jgi:hypothetical protein